MVESYQSNARLTKAPTWRGGPFSVLGRRNGRRGGEIVTRRGDDRGGAGKDIGRGGGGDPIRRPCERELPKLRDLSRKPTLKMIRRAVKGRFPKDWATARQVGLYLSHGYSGRKLREIASEYGVGKSAMKQAGGWMAEVLKESIIVNITFIIELSRKRQAGKARNLGHLGLLGGEKLGL